MAGKTNARRDEAVSVKAPVLFTVEERRIVGEVRDGGNESPLAVGFSIAAEALANGIGGPADVVQVEFTYIDHRFVARAEPVRRLDDVNLSAVSTEALVEAVRNRGHDIEFYPEPTPS